VGLGLAPVLATQIAAHFGWRDAFFVAGIPGFVLGVLAMIFVKEPPKAVVGEILEEDLHVGNVRALLGNRNILLCCLGTSGFIAWLILQNAFAPLFITQVMGGSGTEEGFLLGAAGLGSFCVAFISPVAARRFGRRGALRLFAVLSFFLPIALLTPALYSTPWLLAAILFCTQGGQAITAFAMVLIPTASVPPRLAGSAIGLCNMVGEILGSTAAPIFAGAMIPAHGLGFPLEMASACWCSLPSRSSCARPRQPRRSFNPHEIFPPQS
jgi:predicted MFS family arabinose efflux permease